MRPADIEWFASRFDDIVANVERVIQGKRPVIAQVLSCLLAEGHIIVEDVPGVGKTLLAKSIARSIECESSRIQFTPDLLPSDVTGVSIYNQATQLFERKEVDPFQAVKSITNVFDRKYIQEEEPDDLLDRYVHFLTKKRAN